MINLYKLADKLLGIKEPITNEIGFDYAFNLVMHPAQPTGFFNYIAFLDKRKRYLNVWKDISNEEQLMWVKFHEHDVSHAEHEKQAAIEHAIIMNNMKIALNNWKQT